MAETLVKIQGGDTDYVNPLPAPLFSTTKAYSIGNYCTYQGKMYRFTAAKAAGEWDSAKVTTVTNLASDTDTTLSIAGMAADAKAVGDAASRFENQIAESTGNLFYLTAPKGIYDGITVSQDPDGAINLVGESSADMVTIPLRGSYATGTASGEVNLTAGTYIWGYKIVVGGLQGFFGLHYVQNGQWTHWAANTAHTFANDVLIYLVLYKPSGGSSIVATGQKYYFTLKSGSAAVTEFGPALTAFDRTARSGNGVGMVSDDLEPGGMAIQYGTIGYSHGAYYAVRRTKHFLEIGTAPVWLSASAEDAARISSFSIYEYAKTNAGMSFLGRQSNKTFVDGRYKYTPSTGVTHIALGVSLEESTEDSIGPIYFTSADRLTVKKRPDMKTLNYDDIIFNFEVAPGVYTSGQLILPPSYSIDGSPVPLYVAVHGTGAMSTWEQEMGINGDTDSRYLYQYVANEGFAVFDCYPWTSEYYKATRQISPFSIPIHQKAYVEGIKYVCDRYNVDIDNVCMSFKSLGGNLGEWFMTQSEIAPKALAMLAPSTGWASTIWGMYFLEQNARERIVEILNLEEEDGVEAFISEYRGMRSSEVRAFVETNKLAFAGLNCAAIGVHGSTYSAQHEWMITGERVEPQWMIDNGIPMWPSNWNNGNPGGVPSLVNHPELSKYSIYPVKFWQAPDDVNTSFHANYTIYQWLINGGSDAAFRMLPEGTGGHHAIDTSDTALKSSGTTRLGVAYTGIATTYVEMVDFFYDKMGM